MPKTAHTPPQSEAEGEIAVSDTDYTIYTCAELRNKLKRLQLSVSGNKAALIFRLTEYAAVHGSSAIFADDEQHDEAGTDDVQHEAGNNNERNNAEIERRNHQSEWGSVLSHDDYNAKRGELNRIQFSPKELMEILPDFDAKDDKGLTASEWIRRVEKLKLFYQWPDDLLLISVGPKLKGTARVISYYNLFKKCL